MDRMQAYTLYVDASGGTSWPAPFGKGEDVYYVQAGVALTPEQDYFVHKRLPNIMGKYLGKPEKGTFELISRNYQS